MLRVYLISFIIAILTTGCASNPCYPPSYYDPEPNAPYTAEEAFVFASDGAQLVGTLTSPSDVDPPFLAVILVTGSSPQNRDMMGSRFEFFINYDPLPDARKVSCPVLILHGDRDAHTPFENAHKYDEAMRSGGNKDVTVKILADHNHIFLEDRDGRKSGYLELVKHTNQLSEFVLEIITD